MNHEKISFRIRCADENLKVKVRFIEFIETESTIGRIGKVCRMSHEKLDISAKPYLVDHRYG